MNPKVSISSSALDRNTIEKMWALYQNYYDYDKLAFYKRIESNNYFSFYHYKGEIVGFTGLRINRFRLNGRKHFLIYFGQTVINQQFRGKSLIPRTGFKLYQKFWYELLTSKSFFWADALTYKAYLVFAKTLKQYYPCRQEATPEPIQQLIHHIGKTHYQDTFDVETGTVIKNKNVLADDSVIIGLKDLQDQDIRFFTQANANYYRGHGLITVGHINGTNLKKLTKRLLRKNLKALKLNTLNLVSTLLTKKPKHETPSY